MTRSIRFGGAVVSAGLALGLLGLVLALVGVLSLPPAWLWLLPAVLGSLLCLVILSFHLDLEPTGISRHLGPFVVQIAWSEIQAVQIEALPWFGRSRFVLRDGRGRWISLPLFLLDRRGRQRLSIWLRANLPAAKLEDWLNKGEDHRLRHFWQPRPRPGTWYR